MNSLGDGYFYCTMILLHYDAVYCPKRYQIMYRIHRDFSNTQSLLLLYYFFILLQVSVYWQVYSIQIYCVIWIWSQAWPDHAVKREIANIAVRCNNHEAGCVWTGVFKDLTVCTVFFYSKLLCLCTCTLQKHLDSCEFVTVGCRNPGCGKQVLVSELNEHLKNKCLYRQVECEDCGKKMPFIELQVQYNVLV